MNDRNPENMSSTLLLADDAILGNSGSPVSKLSPIDAETNSSMPSGADEGKVGESTKSLEANSTSSPVPVMSHVTQSSENLGSVKKSGRKQRNLRISTSKVTKRQNEFTKIFHDDLQGQDERLIADFSCALVRDILVQGRLYLTENYCCFHSTILRWETSAIIPYSDITNISKEKTVKIIPNAISVHCNLNKYIFTSFTARDRALNIFTQLWKIKLQKMDQNSQDHHNESGETNETELDITDDPNHIERISNHSQNSEENEMEPPQLYEEEKGSKVFLDAEFPVPVDTLFSLLFLPSSPFWVAFMNIRKTKSWTCQDWKNEADKITREAKCLQHIQMPMGAKDVPQVDHHTLVLSENSKRIVLDARTYIREIPYGDSFHTFNRWQFLRSSRPNTSRLRVATLVIHEKQCWQIVKGFIEKNAYEGNCSFMNELREELGKFIQNGSVCPSASPAGTEPSEGGIDSNTRNRSVSSISVRRASNTLPENTQSATNLLNPSGRGTGRDQTNSIHGGDMLGASLSRSIDHVGAFKHWLVWLFFFFVGVILFSNWSLHSRLATIEANLGMNAYSVDPEQSKFVNQRITENSQKSLNEISELLKLLVKEVRNLRPDQNQDFGAGCRGGGGAHNEL